MKVLVYGSMNLDHIFHVTEFVKPGETLSPISVEQHLGGKGFNQAVAAAKAGLPVYLAGCIGSDGDIFIEKSRELGIDTRCIARSTEPTGSAIIQVNSHGENCILLHGGANQAVTEEQVTQVLSQFEKGDVLVLQNEISALAFLIDEAHRRGMRIALNPSPMNEKITKEMLAKVTWLFVNTTEAEQICGEAEMQKSLEKLNELCPEGAAILTLGSEGSVYQDKKDFFRADAYHVSPVDTTAAGDTFTGFFLSTLLETGDVPLSLQTGNKAAALAVCRMGAFDSIPLRSEVDAAVI